MPITSDWLDHLLQIPRAFRTSGKSLRQLFDEASPPGLTDEELAGKIAARLRGERSLVKDWQTYSYDKRTNASPYLDGLEVGEFDGERRDVRCYDDPVDACADFIVRETRSMGSHRYQEPGE